MNLPFGCCGAWAHCDRSDRGQWTGQCQDNSTFTITTTHPYEGLGTGVINVVNGATVVVDYYKAMTINVDTTSTFTGTEVL